MGGWGAGVRLVYGRYWALGHDAVATSEDHCTGLRASPFLAETAPQTEWLSLCEVEALAPSGAVARTSSGGSIPVVRPAGIDASVTWRRRAEGLVLQIDTAEADRALVWGGVIGEAGEVQQVYWHSEDGVVNLGRSRRGFEADLPAREVRACTRAPGCFLVVQVLRYWRAADERMVGMTERRQVLDLRGAL